MAAKYLTTEPTKQIDTIVENLQPDKVVVVTDMNVLAKVIPALSSSRIVSESPCVAITPGEEGKNLQSVVEVWKKLEEAGATRNSLVLNIGGGVVTDLGGFAAATFKRGIRTVNFPTTLLGAVDAATGGKTGIDFNGLKNEIGAFHNPSNVIISVLPFASLPDEEVMSGYAEMIKTALIADRSLYCRLLNPDDVLNNDDLLGETVEQCVRIKEDVVAQDPQEKGLRKILNFGHTAGHAFESLRISRGLDITHGKAVAHGILPALILSNMLLEFPSMEVEIYRNFLCENYGGALIGCKDVKQVIDLMSADKKNARHGEPLFTLLKEIGEPVINCKVDSSELSEALEIYIDMCG